MDQTESDENIVLSEKTLFCFSEKKSNEMPMWADEEHHIVKIVDMELAKSRNRYLSLRKCKFKILMKLKLRTKQGRKMIKVNRKMSINL